MTVIHWTPGLRSKATRARRAVAVAPRPRQTAAAAFNRISARFTTLARTRLEHVMSARGAGNVDAQVLQAYAPGHMPSTLDVANEAAAFRWLPDVAGQATRERLIGFWVAHSGMEFALDVVAAYLSKESDASCLFQGERIDRALRAYALAAAPEEAQATQQHAATIRERCALPTRSLFASVFLEPTWIDLDLRERPTTPASCFLSELAVLHCPSAARLVDYFGNFTTLEAQFFNSFGAAAVLDRFDVDGVAVLANWLASNVRALGAPEEQLALLRSTRDIVRVLSAVEDSSAVAAPIADLLNLLDGASLGRSEDPRPAARKCLARSPQGKGLSSTSGAVERAPRISRELDGDENGANQPASKTPTSEKPGRTPLARIKARLANSGGKTPLLTLDEFFDGNNVRGSIGANITPIPAPAAFRVHLQGLAQRSDVDDIRIQVTSFDDGERWPFSDTVWVITRASPNQVALWFPKRIRPECSVGWTRGTAFEEVKIPSGMQPVACFWD